MFVKQRLVYLLAVMIVPLSSHLAQDKRTFSMPDSVLLFGTYNDLRVVTPNSVQVFKPPVEDGTNHGYFIYPGLAPQGDQVAWGFAVDFQKGRKYQARYVLGVYSLKEQKWKTYGDLDDIGTPAFSPDGSKIAFVAVDPINSDDLHIFDLATEKMTITITKVKIKGISEAAGIKLKATLGWSPDGKRLVVQLSRRYPKPSLIAVVDLATGDMQPIGEGYNPAWSPTGEWIAYYDLSGEKCMLVHPDGTGTKVARKVKGAIFTSRWYRDAVVWSPDGKKLLLHEEKGDIGAIDVVLFDLETGRSITKSKNGLPVFGWVSRGK